MRDVHPDHGGEAMDASKAILDLNEARRILTTEGRHVTLLLYPGAGSDSDHSSLVAAERLGRPPPVRARRLPVPQGGPTCPRSGTQAARCDQRRSSNVIDDDQPLVMGGRSMGGRMCSMIAAGADDLPPPTNLTGLVLISYPLHPPGKPDRLRIEHLPDIAVPTLFISGSRTPSARPARLTEWTATMPKRAKVAHLWIEGKGHDLKGADHTIAGAIRDFLDRWVR